jgi:NAD(P) transhydrogenase
LLLGLAPAQRAAVAGRYAAVSDRFDFDLVSIGSGPAGQRAAIQAAKLGKRAAVIERRRVLGGVCLETGTIPSKTFREAILATTAARARDSAHARSRIGRFGPAASGRVTADQLFARVEEVLDREAEVLENQMERNGVAMLWGDAAFADPHRIVVREDRASHTLTAANVVIAVGTRPSLPPDLRPDGEVVLTSDDVVRLERLPRSLTVVGAGVIGLEYASMFAALGIPVTIVEKRSVPLEFMDRELIDELIHQMRRRNVTFRLGESVERVEVADGPPKRAIVRLESGKKVVSDAVLFSVGRVGATDTLNLSAASLTCDERGRLAVGADFRTRVPHVFAAGDVIGHPSLAATSAEQGRLAACHAFGAPTNGMTKHFPLGIYAIPELSAVGATEQGLTERKVPYEVGVARYREIARGQILGDDSGMLKMIFHRKERTLLGVHVIGTGATELIHIGQAVLALGGGLDYFLESVFNYPTLAECYKVAALNAHNKLAA